MLSNVADRSFVLVRADWSIDKALRIVDRIKPSHVIIGLAKPDERYYLFNLHALRTWATAPNAQTSVKVALNLERRTPTPILQGDDDELSAPGQAVVFDQGRLIGFVDDEVPPPLVLRWRERGGQEGSAPVARTLVTDFPGEVAINTTTSLLVFLSADLLAGQLPVAVPLGTTIDIVVTPRRGFELVGTRDGSIVVTDVEETQPLQFKLKATEIGLGAIRLYVFNAGQSLGSVTIETQVVASDAVDGAPPPRRETPLQTVPGFTPDLSLIIMEHPVDGVPSLTFTLKTREPYDSPRIKQQYGPIPIRINPHAHFRNFFGQIQNAPLDTERDRRNAERQLTNKGAALYRELVPEDLRAVLWSLRGRISSVQIQSDEPWIPWELCKLFGREGKRIVDGPFFCEAFSITRWLPVLANKYTFSLRNVALVVPQGSGLQYAEQECDYLLSLSTGDRRMTRIRASFEDVLDALKSGTYDGWHFTGHGSDPGTNPDQAELELDDGDVIRPENLSGEVENLGLQRPLVFLNACESGQRNLSLTGVSGWAERFLRAAASEEFRTYGAGAFIGTYWKIDDQAALNFARAFYTALLQGEQTIGDAVRTARQAIRVPGDANWLAYTVFAHPLAKVE